MGDLECDIRSRPLGYGDIQKSPMTQVTLRTSGILVSLQRFWLRQPWCWEAVDRAIVLVPPPVGWWCGVNSDIYPTHLTFHPGLQFAQLWNLWGREWERERQLSIYCFIWSGKLIQHLPLLCWSQELNHEPDSHWLCPYIIYGLVGETDKRNQEAGEYIIQTTEIKNNRRQGIECLLDGVVRESLSEEVSF